MWNRQLDGYLNRVPREFFERVWHILERTPPGIKLSGYILPQVRLLEVLILMAAIARCFDAIAFNSIDQTNIY